MRCAGIGLLLVALCSTRLMADDVADETLKYWPQWRGPVWNGVAPLGDPPVQWSETENLQWKTPIEGRGHSTPIVWDGRIFLVTAIAIDKDVPPPYVVPADTPRINEHNAVITTWEPQALVVMCLDHASGKKLWQQTVCEVMPHQGYHWKGSFASASPITDGQHVYVYFGSFGLYCYDMDGHFVWKKDLGSQAMEDGLGEGSSPALWGNMLVVVVDHELQSFVVAIDKRTGKEIWKQNREEFSNWSTPRIFEHEGRLQVVVNGETVRSYDLATGELLWQCSGQSESAIPMPAVGHGLVFATSGFAEDTLHAIALGQRGDLTNSKHVVWSLGRGTPYVPCPMLWDEEIYLLEDRSFFSCLAAADGERHYFKHRLPGGLSFSSSPVGAADHIYLLSEQGRTVVLQRGPQLKVLAINELDETFYASPAIVGNAIYLRGDKHLFAFRKLHAEE
ncbi:MAG: PQQ-binding-like beta-propeller repeat protein [Aeoliella sp.]